MIVVVGGGVIGLSVAWRAATAGMEVTVVDPEPAIGGASHAAAGMLCPVTEAHFGEEPLLALTLASWRRWPTFAADVEAATGRSVGLRQLGSLLVAADADDARALERLADFHEEVVARHGALGGFAAEPAGPDQRSVPAVERLTPSRCRRLEPLLSPRIRAGLRIDGEASVDNRRLRAALLDAATGAGAAICRAEAAQLEVRTGRAAAVRLQDGTRLAAEAVVVASGHRAGSLAGTPPGARPPVRPVKGEILRLRFDPVDPPLIRNLRAIRHGRSVYLVPRADGELVIGATVEERPDTAVTAGGVHRLLDDATEVLPAVAELEVAEAIARLRPGTPDNGPVLGATPVDGLVLATGHHRNGILLAPVTAETIVAVLAGTDPPPEAAPFTIGRFTPCN